MNIHPPDIIQKNKAMNHTNKTPTTDNVTTNDVDNPSSGAGVGGVAVLGSSCGTSSGATRRRIIETMQVARTITRSELGEKKNDSKI